MPEESRFGYNGKLLRVNLTTRTTSTEELDPMFSRRWLGGAGFVTYYLWKELPEGVDPLGPENKLVFALGPVSGLQLPGSSRHCIGAKSPQTGGLAKCEVGGSWAPELKRAGYDAIIIEGKADKPAYLFVHDGQADIRDAGHLWGKETKETQEAIRTELGDNEVELCHIGPAGENLVRFACIMSGLKDAAGRGGLGAVMGSKNLKAVAARGHTPPEISNKERFQEIRQQMVARKYPMSEFGTGAEMAGMVASGHLPVRNFRDGLFPAEGITAKAIKDTVRVGMEGCYACPVRCKKVVQFDGPYHVDGAYGGPEFETLAAIGSNCGIDDLKAICKGNERLGAYSMDSIAAGVTIAFAMECFERGLLTREDTGGIDLKFGNAAAMLQVIDLIARREGIGDLLAEGTAGMARRIGRGSEAFAMNVKGLEAGMHEPRLRPILGIGFMVSPTGADHMFCVQDPNSPMGIGGLRPLGILQTVPETDFGPRRMAITIAGHSRSLVTDSLCTCVFTGVNAVDALTAVTGWDVTAQELFKVGERILTAARLFNLKQGLTAEDDVLPERFFQPKTDGPLANRPLDRGAMEEARRNYYALMGWDRKGVPLPEKVEELYIE